ncbi:MAG: hypothetical protein GC202_11950 [Alphaproteobacteria bacterium]|nr:hypothetical protein [Alphaproteobacteria bacterium]
MKILIFLDHPIMVRHFVSSGAFSELEARHNVRYVTLPPGHKRIKDADFSAIAPDKLLRLPEMVERSVIWQRMFQIENLRGGKGEQARALARHHEKAIGTWTARIYRLFGLPGVWSVYRRILLARAARLENAPLDALLDAERPDAILHPTVMAGPYLNDLVEATRRRRVPLLAIMNSWDNPSTKRAMVGHPDRLLVWGEQTRAHAIRFAGLPPESVVPFGAAQFDIYRTPPSLDRAAFCARHGIDPARTVVLYAGSSKGTDEYADLDALESAIEDGRLAGASIVYRPHPWGNCGRDGKRIATRPWRHVAFESTMADYVRQAGGGERAITTPAYENTRDVLANVDVVVSPLSTILLEAALNAKQPLCFVDDSDVENWFMTINSELAHFKEFFEEPAFPVTRGRTMLVAGVADAIARARDPVTRAALVRACERFVTRFEAPYARRLADYVAALGEARA